MSAGHEGLYQATEISAHGKGEMGVGVLSFNQKNIPPLENDFFGEAHFLQEPWPWLCITDVSEFFGDRKLLAPK